MKKKILRTAGLVLFLICIKSMIHAQGIFNYGAKMVILPGCNLVLTGSNMNFTNESSGSNDGTVELSGNFKLQGNWFNNAAGILDMSVYTGNVHFYGIDTQVITHSTINNYTIFYGLSLSTGAIVKVPPSKAVTVTQNFSTTGGTFILKSDSAHGTASLIDHNGGSGTNIISERWVKGRQGYHFLSSPVNNSPADSIWINNGNYWFYSYDERLRSDTNRDKGWIRTFPGQNMENARGYSSVFKKSKTLSFTNPIVSGNPVMTVYLSNFTDSIKHDDPNGWNLLGNPFPCSLNADAFINDNAVTTQSISGAVYFWDDIDPVIDRNSDYAVYNLSGGTASTSNNTNKPNGMIAVGQGFFVHKYILASNYPTLNNCVNSIVTFNRSQRIHNFETQFFITEPIIRQQVWLDLSCPSKSLFNEILVSCLPGATDGSDIAYDAVKLKGNSDIAFYSILNGVDYAIQGLPPLNGERKSIPLGMYISYTGNYKIIPYFKDFNDANKIYLEDKFEGKMVNLRTTVSYDFFIANKGEIRDRFVLHFNPLTSIDETGKNTDALKITCKDRNIIISLEGNENCEGLISVCDMSGKILYCKNMVIIPGLSIDLGEYATGCYLIHITGTGIIYTGKVMLK